MGSNQDEQFLEAEGILERPRPLTLNNKIGVASGTPRITNSTGGALVGERYELFVEQHVEEYLSFEDKEPGQWVMAEGTNSLVMKADNFVQGRGQLLSLVRAFPLPDPSFPLYDLLEFKEKRSDEIVAVNYALDKFYSQITSTNDPNFGLERLISVVDRQCADLIKASRENKRRFHLGDISFSQSVDAAESMINRFVAWETAVYAGIGLPLVGGVLGASTSILSVSRGLGAKRKRDWSSSFQIAASMHKEMIQ